MKIVWVLLVMVGIAFSVWLIMETDRTTDLDPPDASFHMERDRDVVHLQFIGGDELRMERITLLVEQDGTQVINGTELGLGEVWDPGEKVCLVGPGCILPDGDVRATVLLDGLGIYSGSR